VGFCLFRIDRTAIAVSNRFYLEHTKFLGGGIERLKNGLEQREDLMRIANRAPRCETSNIGNYHVDQWPDEKGR
jgi:hypothetical protein